MAAAGRIVLRHAAIAAAGVETLKPDTDRRPDMNTEHIIEELRAIAHKAVDDMLAVLASGTDTARLAQQRLADLTKAQQLVLEEQPPAPARSWTMEETPRKNLEWTAEEDQKLQAGVLLGLTQRQIGEMIGRSEKSVHNRLRFLRNGGY